jgi:hypothetical protein
MAVESPPADWGEDVTDFMEDTASGMLVGQMIHGDDFSLREAMSALELMDPKMDAGCTKEKSITLPEAFESVPSQLTDAQTISVMDELVACEASWHAGQSIGHSLFTCLYMQKPDLAPSQILRVYIHLLLKTCQTVRQVILDADVYEEEDFISQKFHFSLGYGRATHFPFLSTLS